MTEEAATINTGSEMTTPGDTEKENKIKMKMGDRQINYQVNPKLRLLLALQKFAGDRALAGAPHHRSAGDGPWAEQKDKGQKNTRASPQVIDCIALT
jgi:hypothetical protein